MCNVETSALIYLNTMTAKCYQHNTTQKFTGNKTTSHNISRWKGT